MSYRHCDRENIAQLCRNPVVNKDIGLYPYNWIASWSLISVSMLDNQRNLSQTQIKKVEKVIINEILYKNSALPHPVYSLRTRSLFLFHQ
jgi:hypothetical protein